jgi:hypothetical protein
MEEASSEPGQLFGAIVRRVRSIARQVVAEGQAADTVAGAIVEQLRAPDLRFAFVFSDWRLDPSTMAHVTQRGLAPAATAGATTIGVIAREVGPGTAQRAVGLGFYGDWIRVGIGVAPDLPKSALTRSRDAVHHAAIALGTTAAALDPNQHVGITLVDGRCGHEEAFCIGSAAAAPQIRMVGGSAATLVSSERKTYVWVKGEVMTGAGIALVLESQLPFCAVTSSHVIPTELKTVVTVANGRVISELDGRPAASRLRDLVAPLGDTVGDLASNYSFARYIDGVPYVRSIAHVDGERLMLASAVDAGHVLRVMRPGDLIGTTTRDLATAAERVGGRMAAFLAFSCLGRHYEAAARQIERELAGAYAAHSSIGFQTFGEQSNMLLVNHTLTGLAIGVSR